MFPFRDHNPSGRTPFVTYALIALNVLIFLTYWAELDDARYMNALLSNWAMVPEFISQGYGQAGLLTSIFLHGGVMHLLGNMLFLYIFGDNIEDELGSAKFLGFYLGTGILANLAQHAIAPMSDVPVIGTSGAVAGMAMIYPRWRAKGSRAFWRATDGVPPHPEATYTLTQSGIPKIPRRPRR